MTGEKVSIIIPVYNAAAFLKETVESVKKQTYENWELLLVDDCSSDDSVRLMEQFAKEDERIRPIRQEMNQGAAQARNRGIQEAEGRYIAFLDADDIWREEKLTRELAFLKEKEAAFVFSGYEFADAHGAGSGKIVRVPEKLTYRQALKNTTIFTSTVLLDVKKLGKELISMPDVRSEDTATWWKILRNGNTAYGLDENLVYYRRSAGTLSANKMEAVRRIWRLYRQTEGLPVIDSFYNFCFYAVRAVLRRI
ncbi:MAG: glycosyltransferase family 2 protein [Clostridiales bacterium]|nr:glycosyltransferase family 2 protein [Clostridiales bacterium]